jgi:hypothetical protein
MLFVVHVDMTRLSLNCGYQRAYRSYLRWCMIIESYVFCLRNISVHTSKWFLHAIKFYVMSPTASPPKGGVLRIIALKISRLGWLWSREPLHHRGDPSEYSIQGFYPKFWTHLSEIMYEPHTKVSLLKHNSISSAVAVRHAFESSAKRTAYGTQAENLTCPVWPAACRSNAELFEPSR